MYLDGYPYLYRNRGLERDLYSFQPRHPNLYLYVYMSMYLHVPTDG